MRSLSLLLVGFAALAMACGGDDDDGTADASTSADAPSADAPLAVDANPSAPDANPSAPDATTTPDASTTPDAKPGSVLEVSCTGLTIAVDITTSGTSFVLTPNAPIPLNGAARITPGANHNALSGANRTQDGLFAVLQNQSKCFQFTEPGAFQFYCSRHNPMEATITVNPN
jgi:hypothetical protein